MQIMDMLYPTIWTFLTAGPLLLLSLHSRYCWKRQETHDENKGQCFFGETQMMSEGKHTNLAFMSVVILY